MSITLIYSHVFLCIYMCYTYLSHVNTITNLGYVYVSLVLRFVYLHSSLLNFFFLSSHHFFSLFPIPSFFPFTYHHHHHREVKTSVTPSAPTVLVKSYAPARSPFPLMLGSLNIAVVRLSIWPMVVMNVRQS